MFGTIVGMAKEQGEFDSNGKKPSLQVSMAVNLFLS